MSLRSAAARWLCRLLAVLGMIAAARALLAAPLPRTPGVPRGTIERRP